MDIKRWLAMRRWWIAAITVSLVVVRIVIGVGAGLAGPGAEPGTGAAAVVTAVLDVLALGLAVVTLVAFVQYGRIFKARVPTE